MTYFNNYLLSYTTKLHSTDLEITLLGRGRVTDDQLSKDWVETLGSWFIMWGGRAPDMGYADTKHVLDCTIRWILLLDGIPLSIIWQKDSTIGVWFWPFQQPINITHNGNSFSNKYLQFIIYLWKTRCNKTDRDMYLSNHSFTEDKNKSKNNKILPLFWEGLF